MLQDKPDIGPAMKESVVATFRRLGDGSGVESEIDALLNYGQHVFNMRNVLKQRKQWDEDRQAKITSAIALA